MPPPHVSTLPQRPSEPRSLTFVLLSGPVAWSVQLAASFALVNWACAADRRWVLHLLMLGGVLVAAAGAALGWRLRRGAGEQETLGPDLGATRSRFLGLGGAGISALFLLATVATSIPHFIIGPCR